jgi:hypothetical protein
MKARIIKSIISTGNAARDFIREVCGSKPTPTPAVAETTTTAGASKVLESFRTHRRQLEPDVLSGKNVIRVLNERLVGYITPAERFASEITRGSFVSIRGDDRRFIVLEMRWDRGAIRVQDDEGYDYMIPFRLIRPWPKEDDE